jgi:hypothetical protein
VPGLFVTPWVEVVAKVDIPVAHKVPGLLEEHNLPEHTPVPVPVLMLATVLTTPTRIVGRWVLEETKGEPSMSARWVGNM